MPISRGLRAFPLADSAHPMFLPNLAAGRLNTVATVTDRIAGAHAQTTKRSEESGKRGGPFSRTLQETSGSNRECPGQLATNRASGRQQRRWFIGKKISASFVVVERATAGHDGRFPATARA